jgi:hypothetical protein
VLGRSRRRPLAVVAVLFWATACRGGDGSRSNPRGDPGQEDIATPVSRGDSALIAAAGRVGAFLRGNAVFEHRLFADTVVLHVAPEGGGAQRVVPVSELAVRSGWTVGGYSLLPPADDRELVMSVGRHLSCIEAPLATQSEALARMPHVGTSLRPAEGGSCLQSWTLTLVFDTTGGSPRVVAALYDQWEW